jgi:hypothetical protein
MLQLFFYNKTHKVSLTTGKIWLPVVNATGMLASIFEYSNINVPRVLESSLKIPAITARRDGLDIRPAG